jgi:hypothetical protein
MTSSAQAEPTQPSAQPPPATTTIEPSPAQPPQQPHPPLQLPADRDEGGAAAAPAAAPAATAAALAPPGSPDMPPAAPADATAADDESALLPPTATLSPISSRPGSPVQLPLELHAAAAAAAAFLGLDDGAGDDDQPLPPAAEPSRAEAARAHDCAPGAYEPPSPSLSLPLASLSFDGAETDLDLDLDGDGRADHADSHGHGHDDDDDDVAIDASAWLQRAPMPDSPAELRDLPPAACDFSPAFPPDSPFRRPGKPRARQTAHAQSMRAHALAPGSGELVIASPVAFALASSVSPSPLLHYYEYLHMRNHAKRARREPQTDAQTHPPRTTDDDALAAAPVQTRPFLVEAATASDALGGRVAGPSVADLRAAARQSRWMACDACGKWRRLPPRRGRLPVNWVCADNLDRAYSRCGGGPRARSFARARARPATPARRAPATPAQQRLARPTHVTPLCVRAAARSWRRCWRAAANSTWARAPTTTTTTRPPARPAGRRAPCPLRS